MEKRDKGAPRAGYYGPGSMTWKVGGEAVVMFGGARAVLMQLAHPLVAEGVYAHSSYLTDPFTRTERTFWLGQLLAFGSIRRAREAARTINRLHARVYGRLPADAGMYRRGTLYHAFDPELLLWVHATLVDTVLLTYRLLLGPLTADEEEQYYQESKATVRLLGLKPGNMPVTLGDLRGYVHEMVYSNRLAATPQARRLARTVLFPPLPSVFRPLLHLHFQLTCALLPKPVREIYGLTWSTQQQRAFELAAFGIRSIVPRLPTHLRTLPITRRLMEQTLRHTAYMTRGA